MGGVVQAGCCFSKSVSRKISEPQCPEANEPTLQIFRGGGKFQCGRRVSG